MNTKLRVLATVAILLFLVLQSQASEKIDIKEVRRLAKLPTKDILRDTSIEHFAIEDYWKKVNGRNKPLVVFFFSNSHGPSQRLATLIRYVAPHYKDKLSFACVKVADKGKPDAKISKILVSKYSVDGTPGILFYDNVGTDMVLEDEDYIDPDFKEFRTPKMLLWRTYYDAVRKELDKLLAD